MIFPLVLAICLILGISSGFANYLGAPPMVANLFHYVAGIVVGACLWRSVE